jgi:phosphoribosylformylglycinamidine synthase I
MSHEIGVLVFPGSNCDRDAAAAWTELGLGRARMLWHRDTDLSGLGAVVVPGGFSYGDALRAGAIARFSPVMEAVAQFAAAGGPVIGICNGFQILCEAGLLPGALARNEGLRFVCKPVELTVCTADSPFLSEYQPGQRLVVPVAHGEGRYCCDHDTHSRLIAEDRVAFRYAGADNPNGSYDRIAGIVGGPRRNILGMMPHPERAVRPELGSGDGAPMFVALRNFLDQT